MKKLTRILMVIVALTSTFTQASEVSFEINGIKSDAGKILIQLFQGKDNYESGNAESALIVKAKTGSVTVNFNELDEGEYIIRFFHDENSNGKLETNLFGAPVEGYGFSNNAKPDFGPVNYSAAKFVVQSRDDKVTNSASVIY
ncbi:DUF2141 domain-containing protein [Psychrosphaera sp. F3M07]|uniref:DUF2141 domain-containing protein n=2 Tax=Psychrosphaera TaxID=907197 RepID=UPI001C090FAA|nr:DUF2141 domain-containing protein [Psychrosphaera sp. F3M07]MBU2918149.1 DUF2141 domain-containing protein [Psychrosphaera sp. F3M07]